MKRCLQGITWDHSRGLVPMVATAQRFQERHPDTGISWQTRSLQAFADQPIRELAGQFDLLVIDHPFVGFAAAHPVLLPLDEHLPELFLEDQARNSVGASHASYSYEGHQWALAIDAAAPVSSWRPDLLSNPPRTWADLLRLARKGRVAVPGSPVDALMNFYMLCVAEGEEPFCSPPRVVSDQIGLAALARLSRLHALCPRQCLGWNPIRLYEAMTATDDLWYCPFAYGYSNYAREGYARRQLTFGDIVDDFHSTLGGTGLAISSRTRHRRAALEYAQFVAGESCQSTMYVESGGQPGHRAAWRSAAANRLTGGYFRNTLPALDRAYVRPRYNGYLHFQDLAGPVLCRFLKCGGDPQRVLRRFNRIYRESQQGSPEIRL